MGKNIFSVALVAIFIGVLPCLAAAQQEADPQEFVMAADDIFKWGIVQNGDGINLEGVAEITVLVLTDEAAVDIAAVKSAPGGVRFFFEDIPLRGMVFMSKNIILIAHEDTRQGIMGLLPEDRQTVTDFSQAFLMVP